MEVLVDSQRGVTLCLFLGCSAVIQLYVELAKTFAFSCEIFLANPTHIYDGGLVTKLCPTL